MNKTAPVTASYPSPISVGAPSQRPAMCKRTWRNNFNFQIQHCHVSDGLDLVVGQHMYSILNWASGRAWLPMSAPCREVQLAALKALGLMGMHRAARNLSMHGLVPLLSMRA
jgi:hypothetical protein